MLKLKCQNNYDNIIDKVLKKEIEKTDWMKEVEDEENDCGYRPDIFASKIIKFLYSTEHDGMRDG